MMALRTRVSGRMRLYVVVVEHYFGVSYCRFEILCIFAAEIVIDSER